MANNEEASPDLKEALSKAFDETENEENSENEESEEENQNQEGEEENESSEESENQEDADDKEDDEEEETDSNSDEAKNALKFIRDLQDPEKAERFLKSVAAKTGYELKSLSGKQQDAVVDEIENTLKEELGDDYTLVPNNFAKALTKIVEKIVGKDREEITTLRDKVRKSEEIQHVREVDAALAWAVTEYPGFVANEKKILREMKAFPAPEGMNHRDYVKKICKLVGVEPKKSVNDERNSRNQNNKDGRKPSVGVPKERSSKTVNSLRDAMELAYEEMANE